MRGKVVLSSENPLCRGITPAYAGKSWTAAAQTSACWDHPRVCGEKMVSMIPHRRSQGSPPRVRGKVVLSSENPLCRGITPAYAGKSWTAAAQTSACWDHPRVCGEKMVSMIPHRRSRGSPPRVRGKEWYLQGESPAPGITPAYAGKSGWRSCCPGCNRDHPRVCGEKSQPAVRRSCAKGSPPRVRGKGVQSCNERVAVGITPAYAGKSWGRARTSSRRRDHPRVCGEKSANFSHLLPP